MCSPSLADPTANGATAVIESLRAVILELMRLDDRGTLEDDWAADDSFFLSLVLHRLTQSLVMVR